MQDFSIAVSRVDKAAGRVTIMYVAEDPTLSTRSVTLDLTPEVFKATFSGSHADVQWRIDQLAEERSPGVQVDWEQEIVGSELEIDDDLMAKLKEPGPVFSAERIARKTAKVGQPIIAEEEI